MLGAQLYVVPCIVRHLKFEKDLIDTWVEPSLAYARLGGGSGQLLALASVYGISTTTTLLVRELIIRPYSHRLIGAFA